MTTLQTSRPVESSKTTRVIQSIVVYGFLTTLTLIWLLPVIAAFVTSFRTQDDISVNGFWSWPQIVSWSNFIKAWTAARVAKYLLNSFIITIPSLLGMLFLSSLAAYTLARHRFRGNLTIYFMFVAGTMLPFQILMLPVFRLTNYLGLYDTYGSLILIHTAFQMGFCTFVLRNFMKTVPNEILDAARVDGCSEFRIYWQIMLPLTLPALAAVATLEFTWVFNDYLWAIILLRSDALRPVTAGLATLRGQYNTDWPVITAGALLATVPTLLVFIFLQRYFIQGLTLGSSK